MEQIRTPQEVTAKVSHWAFLMLAGRVLSSSTHGKTLESNVRAEIYERLGRPYTEQDIRPKFY